MSSVRLRSIDALQTLSAALRRFEEEAGTATVDLEMEVRRAVEWIEEEKDYWTAEIRRSEDRLTQAKLQLQQAQMRTVADHRPTCHDEKKAVDRARRRAEVAREKAAVAGRWQHTIERQVIEFFGPLHQLSGWVQIDLPKAVALLGQMAKAVEAYLAQATPGAAPPPLTFSTLVADIDTAAAPSPPPETPPAAEIALTHKDQPPCADGT